MKIIENEFGMGWRVVGVDLKGIREKLVWMWWKYVMYTYDTKIINNTVFEKRKSKSVNYSAAIQNLEYINWDKFSTMKRKIKYYTNQIIVYYLASL